jgi:hypothetical protein
VPPQLAGAAAAVAVAAAWVLLTAVTAKTYHLAPVIVAAAPGLMLRLQERGAPRQALLAAALGGAIALSGGLIIVVADFDLGSTIIRDQPGGVTGEVVTGALIGLLAGGMLARDPPEGK